GSRCSRLRWPVRMASCTIRSDHQRIDDVGMDLDPGTPASGIWCLDDGWSHHLLALSAFCCRRALGRSTSALDLAFCRSPWRSVDTCRVAVIRVGAAEGYRL